MNKHLRGLAPQGSLSDVGSPREGKEREGAPYSPDCDPAPTIGCMCRKINSSFESLLMNSNIAGIHEGARPIIPVTALLLPPALIARETLRVQSGSSFMGIFPGVCLLSISPKGFVPSPRIPPWDLRT
jgi:hypothetical protein